MSRSNTDIAVAAPRDSERASVFACPSCRTRLVQRSQEYECQACRRSFPIKQRIPIFTEIGAYWNNVDRPTMQSLLDEAEACGDWLAAMQRRMPRLVPAAAPAYRADAQFMFPIGRTSRVLDAGSMWGGLSFPIAEYCGEVYAVDQTWETLRLLDIRARQSGASNVHPVLSALSSLPFPDGFFDFVVLNGVLEWVATEQELVVDRHLEGKRPDRHRYAQNPRDVQLAVLRELCRVTRPDGGLYVAIENRAGLQYVFGWPDDHVNIRFVPFLPRPIANVVTRALRGTDYRTYIYSPAQLAALLTEAGYPRVKLHAINPYYGRISTLVPFDVFPRVRRLAFHTEPDPRLLAFSRVWAMTPPAMTPRVAPSLGAIGLKDGAEHPARLLRLLADLRIAEGAPSRYEAVLVNWRFGDLHTVNHVIVDREASKPILFCKVSRTARNAALDHESRTLEEAGRRLRGTPLAARIPQFVYYGRPEGIPLQVTRFIDAGAHREGVSGHLRRIDKLGGRNGLGAVGRSVQRAAGRRWLAHMDARFRGAIDFLVDFQKQTTVRMLSAAGYDAVLEARGQSIAENGLLSEVAAARIEACGVAVRAAGCDIPICMVHGDFDICNVLGELPQLTFVDFEHAELEGLPFFDVGNLMFSPLLTQWRTSGTTDSLQAYAASSGWTPRLQDWTRRYARRSGLPLRLLEWLPVLTAIEQNAIRYPAWREPTTYPLFGERPMHEMLSWRLSLA